MPIQFYDDSQTFKLDTEHTSYVFYINEYGKLIHLYFGAKIHDTDMSYLKYHGYREFHPNPIAEDNGFSLNSVLQEYPTFGCGDFRRSALAIRGDNGCLSTDLIYKEHRIIDGKYTLDGLPAVYDDGKAAQTLAVTVTDPLTGANVELLYAVIEGYDAVMRATRIHNRGSVPFTVERAASCAVDFNTMEFDLVHLQGRWARERQIEREPLTHNMRTASSLRGASGHAHNPFAALLSKHATEDVGEVYGFSLVYSGSFAIETECDSLDQTRVVMGIHPDDFSWKLDPDETFCTPESVLVFSSKGIGGMSRTFHTLYRDHLCRGEWKNKRRPIVLNNWEATYFDFNDEKLLGLAKEARSLGVELLVMDDGWFGHRNSDAGSMGDWYVNREKLPHGLGSLVDDVRGLGMEFGIWFEPEVISEDSALFRAHPDWVLCAPGRTPSLGRNEYILDLTRRDVHDYLVETLSAVLNAADIRYVKWDFNRNLTEVGSAAVPKDRQGEVMHRYVLGVYEILERLTALFPHVLFEGCSGGGGRFDPGMLYYFPQIWTSDNTDAMDRCKIQYGTSLVYPLSAMSAHVSAVPNHQTGRVTPLATRGNVAYTGAFGYELDLFHLDETEKEEIRQQIDFYKQYASVFAKGDLYRLVSPFDDPHCCAWECVSADKQTVAVTLVVMRSYPYMSVNLRLKGLDPAKQYRSLADGRVYYGDTLMNAGLNLNGSYADDESRLLIFQVVS